MACDATEGVVTQADAARRANPPKVYPSSSPSRERRLKVVIDYQAG